MSKMTTITIPIPQSLHKRIASMAEELGMSTGHLAGLWLWRVEREERLGRNERSKSREVASRDDGNLSAKEDD